MFTPLLFNHKYDIDDIVQALCGEADTFCMLNTNSGEITPSQEVEEEHLFLIPSLPLQFLEELKTCDSFKKLSEEAQEELITFLEEVKNLPSLFEEFSKNKTFLHGWLSERVKEKAIEFLGSKKIIPPSMLHTPTYAKYKLPPSTKVQIQLDES